MTISGRGANWLVGGAILSLCLNLFLLGWMAAARVHGPYGGMFGHGERDRRGGMLMETVPPELKPVLRQKFMEQGLDPGAERERMQEVRAHVADALSAEPFDRGAFDAALAGLQQSAGSMMEVANKALSEVAAGLSPEQRRLWADGWRRAGKRP